jgi:GNAT superfamily N-acetyltransferase
VRRRLSSAITIRAATPGHVPLVYSLIVELAAYERAPEKVTGNEELLDRALFGSPPHAEAVIAELDGEPVGFALYFGTFSTWLCLPGLWLEDLYVRPEQRRAGVGRALLAHVARVAVERGCGRLEWTVLDWNSPAIAFYESLGAETMREWDTLRLSGDALSRIATLVGDQL